MKDFSVRLLAWYRQHGRHDLPWQQQRTPYRVWIAEIMLQQTQVATVIPYYDKFIQRFVDIASLAAAEQDEVLLYWAGLGYYSRARNLHDAARRIVAEHSGIFPQDYEAVLALPGIGPSTAGAILSQSLGQRHAILDGNVKRVLSRHRAIEGWYGISNVEKQLWRWAEAYTPMTSLADYTQAVMDLGATVCTRSSPDCEHCPLQDDCLALAQERVGELPTKKPKKPLPIRRKRFLIIRDAQGRYLMEKRPPSGIWGGLWSLPELTMDAPVAQYVAQQWQLTVNKYKELPVFRHTFSHFHLDITPCDIQLAGTELAVAEQAGHRWHDDITTLALAAPVMTILNSLH